MAVVLHEQQKDDFKDYDPFNNPDIVVVKALVRVSADPKAVDTFRTRFTIDFVTVKPCGTSPVGFCREIPFKDEL